MGRGQQHGSQPAEMDAEYGGLLYLMVVQYGERVSCPLFHRWRA